VLADREGRVIGINSAIRSDGSSGGNIGIGFAVPINTVRELLPQLRQGKVIRGRIGVSVIAVPREDYAEFGLKSRMGALVTQVPGGAAASKAGVEPGDVIVEFNGRPVQKSDDLVKMVVATKPGTTVPLKVMRNKQEQTMNVTVEELDLDAEQARGARRNNDSEPPVDEATSGFGLTLQNLTPQAARQLQVPSGRSGALVTDIDPNGPAAGRIQTRDVILSVNRRPVADAADAKRELGKVTAGHIAQILLWRNDGEVFVTVKKD
jgi:serine protease Do